MTGNCHVRFLEGKGAVRPLTHSVDARPGPGDFAGTVTGTGTVCAFLVPATPRCVQLLKAWRTIILPLEAVGIDDKRRGWANRWTYRIQAEP